jgi:hypothetical protein
VKKPRIRVPGGVAPLAKPITVDYDSDDGRIIDLKQQGYSDAQVADTLRQEGRTRYVDKTIGSRFLRIRKLLLAKEDEQLDDELSDWHVGEVRSFCSSMASAIYIDLLQDEKLLPLTADIEKKYEAQIRKLEEQKWRDIAHHLADKLGKRKYTAKAVRERVEALRDGTELCPIELDPDQPGRRKMREDRIAAAKKVRAEKAAAEKAEQEDKVAKAAARKLAIAEANQKKVMVQLKRLADKNERLRIREERKVNRERARINRLAILASMRAQRDWDMERNRKEKQIYRTIMGVEVNGKPCRVGRNTKSGYESDNESGIDELESDEEEARGTEEEQGDSGDESNRLEADLGTSTMDDGQDASVLHAEPASAIPSSTTSRPQKSKTFPRNTNFAGKRAARSGRPRRASIARTPTSESRPVNDPSTSASTSFPVTVTEDTIMNSRSIMSRDELEELCSARGLARLPESNETHQQLVARLNAADHALPTAELDGIVKRAGGDTSGAKATKIKRMQMAEAAQSSKGGMGLTTNDIDFMRTYEGFRGEFSYLLNDAERAQRHR